MERTILHSDMNSFYASVEMMLDPALRGKAVAVCGSTESRHGIVLAKSELAKKAGVKTGMANWEARQACKDLIVVPPHYDQYLKYSKLAHDIYYRYTDLVEPFGMDECWLDVSGSGMFGDGLQIAEEIRQAVKFELGLTVSIGVSFNKIFAKLGSDMKKPDAITVITQDNFRDKVWPLEASELLYVGRSTARKLRGYGIHTIGQMAAVDPETLRKWFGINGTKLWHFANGTDQSRVMHRDFVSPIKSVGHGITCISDLHSKEEVWKVILELSQDVGHRLKAYELAANGVQIGYRNKELGFGQFQTKMILPTQNPLDIAQTARRLFNQNYSWNMDVRALTVRAIDLTPKSEEMQLVMSVDPQRMIKREKLDYTVDELRNRFGKRVIYSAILMGDLKMPGDGREEVIMPGLMFS